MFKRTEVSTALAIAFGGALAFAAMPGVAQQAEPEQKLERVEITGSSLRRLGAETSQPVTVIKVEELAKQGITTAEQALSRIASNQSNFGVSASIGATTGGKAEADIRGLSGPSGNSSNKTLVLLNGRRLANHAFDAAAVDLNAIPFAAIERIEVLRDGASAIYGTDAIGGVINFILRKDFKGIEVSAETQKPESAVGGGDTQRVNVTAGFGSLSAERFNVVFSLDSRKQSALEAKDRSFSKSGVLGTRRIDVTNGTSGTSFPGDLNGFEPSGPNCDPPSSIPRNTNADNTGAFNSCRYDFARDVDIIPKNEQLTGLVRGAFAITPEHTASVEYLRANNKVTSRVAAAPTSDLMPASSPFFPVGAPLTSGGIPDLNSTDPTATVPGGVANWRQVPAGKRTSGDNTTTERGLIELKGTVRDWDYKAGAGISRNKSTASVKRGYVNDDLIQQGVFDGIINPFGAQTAAGQALIESAQVVADTLIGKNEVKFGDFQVSGELAQLSAGPLMGAFGVEYRKEESAFVATDITATLGSLGIDPDSDTGGSRKQAALFSELSIPVLKSLDVTLAARYDKFSDFGHTFNPKVGARWQPSKELVFRGSYNTGFRAPTLYEIYAPQSRTFTTDNYDDPLLCPGGAAVPGASAGAVCGQQVLQRNAGPVGVGKPLNSLQPEKSKSQTLGVLFEPVPELTMGVDFWKIVVKDQISGLPEQAVFGNPTKYASRFVRCSALSAAQRSAIDVCLNFPSFDPIAFIDTPTENLGELRTSGLDVTGAWRGGATPIGNFGAVLDITYITKYQYQREQGGEFIDALGRYSDNAPVFRWQHVLTFTYGNGPWGATLSHRYKTGYTDQDPTNRVGSYEVFDGSLSFLGIKGLTVTAGIKNLFDAEPPRSFQTTTFQRGYDPRFTDPLGRTYTLRGQYKF